MSFDLLDNSLENLARLLNRFSKKIEVTVQDVKVDNLDKGLDGIVIAQISDLHINDKNVELVEHAVEILNTLNPDIVTMTGDAICNGKKFIPVYVTENMIGHKLGEFSPTRTFKGHSGGRTEKSTSLK